MWAGAVVLQFSFARCRHAGAFAYVLVFGGQISEATSSPTPSMVTNSPQPDAAVQPGEMLLLKLQLVCLFVTISHTSSAACIHVRVLLSCLDLF